jgi:hypothetical protein
MLHSIGFYRLHGVIIHFDRHGDGKAAFGVLRAVSVDVGDIENVGGTIKLVASHFENVRLVEGSLHGAENNYPE